MNRKSEFWNYAFDAYGKKWIFHVEKLQLEISNSKYPTRNYTFYYFYYWLRSQGFSDEPKKRKWNFLNSLFKIITLLNNLKLRENIKHVDSRLKCGFGDKNVTQDCWWQYAYQYWRQNWFTLESIDWIKGIFLAGKGSRLWS